MNRSILIIICDFLVLSALSLATGTGDPAPRGKVVQASALVTRNAYLDQMRDELAKRAQVQQEKKGLEADKADLESDNARLAAERARLEAEMKRLQQILAQARRESTDKAAELRKAQSVLTEKEKQLNLAQARHEVLSTELTQSRTQIVALSVDLQKSKEEAKRTSTQLAARENDLKLSMGRMREAELGLAMTSGKLNVTEKELAEAKGTIRKSERNLFKTEVDLKEAKTRLENMKALLNDAVTNLSQTQGELKSARQQLVASVKDREQAKVELARIEAEAEADKANLQETRARLTKAEDQLRSDALTCYAAAAVEVLLSLQNERLLLDSKVNEKIYLPEVAIGGKTYLASTFRAMTGTTEIHTGYNKISRLDYQMKKPDAQEDAGEKLQGPILTLNADSRACLIPVDKPLGKPLEAITYKQLKERGLQDLTLFKFKSFGKETAALEGRCSLNLSGDGKYMYIRNSVRSHSELAAGEGDFVISRQGQLVGVVVAVHSYDFGNREEAQCFIFPEKIDLKETVALPIVKPEGEKYYTQFVKVLRELQQKASRLNSEYTPQAQ